MEFCNSSRDPRLGYMNLVLEIFVEILIKNAIFDCEIVFEKNDCESWAIVWAIDYDP